MPSMLEERQPTVKDGAFSFDNCARNMALEKAGLLGMPRPVSTGTTIVAVQYIDGVIMGADSRATAGSIIADKHCRKVHRLTDSIYACGAGTAADLYQVAEMLSANLRLIELNTARRPHVITAVRRARQHLYRYQGHIGAYLLVGGVDATGAHLYEVNAHGNSVTRPFASDGSGSYAATSVLERDFKMGMSMDEAQALTQRALEAGMHGDNMSGNSLNLVTITKDSTVFKGPIVPDFCLRPDGIELEYKFKPGTTEVLKQKTVNYEVVESMEVE